MKTILSSDSMDISDGVEINVKAKLIEIEEPRGKLSRNFKHLNLDFQLTTDEATQRPSPAAAAPSGGVQNYSFKFGWPFAVLPVNFVNLGSFEMNLEPPSSATPSQFRFQFRFRNHILRF